MHGAALPTIRRATTPKSATSFAFIYPLSPVPRAHPVVVENAKTLTVRRLFALQTDAATILKKLRHKPIPFRINSSPFFLLSVLLAKPVVTGLNVTAAHLTPVEFRISANALGFSQLSAVVVNTAGSKQAVVFFAKTLCYLSSVSANNALKVVPVSYNWLQPFA